MDALIKKIPIRTLASGDELTIESFTFKGSGKAPTVYIQSSVHGAEVQGNLVIYYLIEYLKENPPKGDITLVPKANPYGINQKMGEYTYGRFDPTTGDNYNRLYWDLSEGVEKFAQENFEESDQTIKNKFFDFLKSTVLEKQDEIKKVGSSYGRKLCLYLQEMANQHEIVLDLHTASTSVEHLYTPQYCLKSGTYLGIDYVIESPLEFYGALEDAVFMPWVKLSEVLKDKHQKEFSLPIESFTIELGSQEEVSANLAKDQLNRIINFLSYRGLFDKPSKVYQAALSKPMENYKGIFAPTGGLFSPAIKVGSQVSIGDILGYIYCRSKKIEILSPYQGVLINQFASAAVHEGHEIYRILAN